MNVFRLNFSHGAHEDKKRIIESIRKISVTEPYNIAILGDLQGPKLRVGEIENNALHVKEGDILTFTNEKMVGTMDKIYVSYPNLAGDVVLGNTIMIDDGKIEVVVQEVMPNGDVKVRVKLGGIISSKKGLNLPDTKISLPALTEKDIEDAIFAIGEKVDWIALSFVRFSQDLKDLQELIAKHTDLKIPIVSKIEKPEAIDNIDEIIEYTDALMVARGDLGLEIPAEEVPLIQKQLVLKAKQARKPIIIATQMMETMIDSLTPTRAEVNDVANSVMDGADAVMLSGETSVGQYPVQVIEKMSSILRAVEHSELIRVPLTPPVNLSRRYVTKSVCYHAAIMANEMNTAAISTLTNSGYTAYQISAWRPSAHILVFTSNKRILTQLNLLWGVQAFYYDSMVSTDQTILDLNEMAKKAGYVSEGDTIINLASMPIKERGMVNTLRVSSI